MTYFWPDYRLCSQASHPCNSLVSITHQKLQEKYSIVVWGKRDVIQLVGCGEARTASFALFPGSNVRQVYISTPSYRIHSATYIVVETGMRPIRQALTDRCFIGFQWM
jgi:hypothetical protein